MKVKLIPSAWAIGYHDFSLFDFFLFCNERSVGAPRIIREELGFYGTDDIIVDI
jgi:hypothetical protein